MDRVPGLTDADSAHREDLRALAQWAERTFRLYVSLAARYDRFPGALIVGQQQTRAAIQDLLQRHRVSVPGTAADADAWVASRVLADGTSAADLIDATLAATLRVLDGALRGDIDSGTRTAYQNLYAAVLRQERLVRSWPSAGCRSGASCGGILR